MWRSGGYFGRGRRKASAGVIVCFLALFLGIEFARDEYQRRQEYSGTITRRYSALQFASRKSYRLYWDIRSSDGEIHSPWIRPRSYWESAREGAHVVKKAGELYPTVVSR